MKKSGDKKQNHQNRRSKRRTLPPFTGPIRCHNCGAYREVIDLNTERMTLNCAHCGMPCDIKKAIELGRE